MAGRRLGLWPYLGLWAVLVACQVWVFTSWAADAPGMAVALAALLQVAKIPITVWRLEDLGFPPDDAVLALVPLANVGLWRRLHRGTPAPEVRVERRSKWSEELSATQAYVEGVRGILRSPGAVLPAVLVFACLFALGEIWTVEGLARIEKLPELQQQTTVQALLVVVVLLGLYTGVQIAKRHTASRASWLPTFFFLPLLMVWITTQVAGGAAPDPNSALISVVLSTTAWSLLWSCVGGAALGILWVSAAEAQRDGRRLGLGEILGRIRRRTADVAAPHGAAAIAILVGMQVIIPGIVYALQFSFVDAAAVWHPDVPALRRSTRLTQGIRRRIFKVWTYGFLAGLPLSWLFAFPVELVVHRADMTVGQVFSLVIVGVPTLLAVAPLHLTQLSGYSLAAVMAANGLALGASRVGLAHLYRQRLARVESAAASA